MFKPSGLLAIHLLSWLSLQTLPKSDTSENQQVGFHIKSSYLTVFFLPYPPLAWHPGIRVTDGAKWIFSKMAFCSSPHPQPLLAPELGRLSVPVRAPAGFRWGVLGAL